MSDEALTLDGQIASAQQELFVPGAPNPLPGPLEGLVHLVHGDSLSHYATWPSPTLIVSDGAYGIGGFIGDPRSPSGLAEWYEPHVAAWSCNALPSTSVWFWNTEIGWASTHPLLEAYGWEYIQCCVWDKGMAHAAGNVNTVTLRRFPTVTELCALYVRPPQFEEAGDTQTWLRNEWMRTGLPFAEANIACGVKDAATRKYLCTDHVWYFPPPAQFSRLVEYANLYGAHDGRPYFVLPAWANKRKRGCKRAKFTCPYGKTNVWQRPPLSSSERVRNPDGATTHPNQKPLDLLDQAIRATTGPGDVVWEPFGGLFSASIAAALAGRQAYAAETNPAHYRAGVARALRTVPVAQDSGA